MNSKKVNKNAPIPVYLQLRDLLQEKIASGEYRTGDRIPSETELSSYHNISRMTVRQATNELFGAGMLYKIRGKGTFVAKPKMSRDLSELTSHTERLRRSGYNVVTKVLEVNIISPPEEPARNLEISENEKIIKLSRLRMLDNRPFLWEVSFLPYELCPALVDDDLERDSLYRLLEEKYGLSLDRAVLYLEAVAANKAQSELLRVKMGAPLLRIKQTTYLIDGRPIQFVEVISRSDEFKYQFSRKKNR